MEKKFILTLFYYTPIGSKQDFLAFSTQKKKPIVLNRSHHVHKKSKEKFFFTFFKKEKCQLFFFLSYSDLSFFLKEQILFFYKKNSFGFLKWKICFITLIKFCPYSLVVKTLLFHSKIEGSIPSKGIFIIYFYKIIL